MLLAVTAKTAISFAQVGPTLQVNGKWGDNQNSLMLTAATI